MSRSMHRIPIVLLVLALSGCGAGARPTTDQPRWTALRPPASPGIVGSESWPIYRGTRVPFSVAYPSGWAPDEASAVVGEISFAPNSASGGFATIAVRDAVPALPVALARERYLSYVTRICEYGREGVSTADASISGIIFSTARANCELERASGDVDTTFFVGVAVVGEVEWRFAFQCDEDDFAANSAAYFTPMLSSLTLPGVLR